ncbi:hypothetical protein BG005_002196 [Podila minutissima]|nr:hypothetical protein BG005_002196 [Podila minutissima]
MASRSKRSAPRIFSDIMYLHDENLAFSSSPTTRACAGLTFRAAPVRGTLTAAAIQRHCAQQLEEVKAGPLLRQICSGSLQHACKLRVLVAVKRPGPSAGSCRPVLSGP